LAASVSAICAGNEPAIALDEKVGFSGRWEPRFDEIEALPEFSESFSRSEG